MSTTSKVIDRIRKLLALAKSSNENEAANAAAQAAKLMHDHQLEEAQLEEAQLEIDTGVSHEEVLEDVAIDAKAKSTVSWKLYLLNAVCQLNGAKNYTSRGVFHVFGTPSVIQTVTFTYNYLCEQVERLVTHAWEIDGQNGAVPIRRWKNAFRLGCASRIYGRIMELKKARDAANDMGRAGGDKALIVLHNRHEALVKAFDVLKGKLNLVSSSGRPTFSSGSAFKSGQAAGDTVDIGGNQKALGAGQPRLSAVS